MAAVLVSLRALDSGVSSIRRKARARTCECRIFMSNFQRTYRKQAPFHRSAGAGKSTTANAIEAVASLLSTPCLKLSAGSWLVEAQGGNAESKGAIC